ncbi:MAG: selenocysteine-specific translation elongation factor [Dehalococcoidia bacterium]
MFVIGTAGHVDHGKSALIEALTGTHPDRLKEEQERGLTIELGFAWLTLPSGREVSIVDVPGHVRFVRHMLAGAGAIDLALLVIAADEGIMPQTREHLEILDLLDVRHAVVALTKIDLVDADWADLVEEEVRELLEPTALGGAPVVRVSSVTREGIDALLTTLDAALDAVPEPEDIGRPRLGIDRVFTMSGFGTVVTGTLLDGRVRIGDTLDATPGGPSARVRGLQTHRRAVDEAQPGTRVAVNLAGVATDDLARGQVLAPPGRMTTARTLDARLRVLDHRAVRHNLRVSVHLGTAEVQGRVRVIAADAIAAGEAGWCQLVLAEPLAAVPGDLFVLRVSDETVAGGRVVEVNAPRHRRHEPRTLERLAARAEGTPESRLLAALERAEPASAAALAAGVEVDAGLIASTLDALVAAGDVRALAGERQGTLYITSAGLARLRAETLRVLAAYHRERPLRVTMPREELRSRLRLPQREFGAVLDALTPEIAARGEGVAEEAWTPAPDERERHAIDEVMRTLRDAGLQAPRLAPDGEVVAYLVGAGLAIDCGDGLLLDADAFRAAQDAIVALLEARASITLAEARDALATNRRSTQAVLETLDRRGVTRRQGEGRVLGDAARARPA